VIGDKPDWYTGEFIPKPRIPKTDFHAFRDCYSKLLFAAEQLPRFIWHMDDIYWIKPFTMAEATVPKYVRHVSQTRFKAWNPHNTWGKTRAHAYRWLLDHNRPTYDFAAHLPQPIQSEKLLATEREVQMMTSRYRNWECVYFVNLRLKQYQSLALQTVPVGKREPDLALLVLFDLCFFGRRPGWRFGTV
jgi:hypothetical protein